MVQHRKKRKQRGGSAVASMSGAPPRSIDELKKWLESIKEKMPKYQGRPGPRQIGAGKKYALDPLSQN